MQSCRAPLDILIQGGTLLTMTGGEEIVVEPQLGIRDGKILFIAPAHDPLAALYAPGRSSMPRDASSFPAS